MGSVSDDLYAYLGTLGYTGSLADRQRQYLLALAVQRGFVLGNVDKLTIDDLNWLLGYDGFPNQNQIRINQLMINAKTTRTDIGFLGASIVEGLYASFNKSIPNQMGARLRAKYGVGVANNGFIGIPSDSMSLLGTWPVVRTLGGYDSFSYSMGPKHRSFVANIDLGFINYTWPVAQTGGVKLHMYIGTGGGANAGYYKVDGGAAVDFNTLNGSVAYQTITIPGPVTTLEVGRDAAGGVYIVGAEGFTENSANPTITCHNLGVSGFAIDHWRTVVVTPTPLQTVAQQLNLDLLVLQDFPINDGRTGGQNQDAPTFKTKLLAMIADLRAAGLACPIVVAVPYNTSKSLPMASPWGEYKRVMKEVVDADSTLLYFDHSAYMPGPLMEGSEGLYGADNVHTNTNGAALDRMVDNYMKYLF